MISTSVPLMTVLDLVIIAITGGAVWSFVQIRGPRSSLAHTGPLLIISGLLCITLLYFADLVTMHILPLFMPMAGAVAIMDSLHLNYSWLINLLAVSFFGVGLRADIIERKQTDNTLCQSDERNTLAIAATNDGIWERNFLTGEIYRSPRMLQILGYQPGELGLSREAFVEIIHPEDVEKSKNEFYAHLETGVPYNVEYRIRRKSGAYIWVSAKAQAAWDKDGKPVRMAGSINDITERKRADEALGESERRYRGLIENFGLGIHITKPEGGRLFVNNALARLLGYESPEEIFEFPVFHLIAPHDREMSGRYRRMAGENGRGVLRYECDFVRKDGSIMPLQVFISKIVWQGEEAVLRTVIDLTERKKAEAALRESEKRFRDISETTSDWIWESGPDFRFTYFSERYTEATGFRPEDRIGTKREDFTPAFETADNAAKWAAHYEDLRARRPFRNFEYASTATEDGYRYVSVSGKPFFDSDGKFLGHRGTATDITERRQAEEALRESEERFRSIFESGPAGNIVIDESGIIENVNPGLEKIFGYRPGEMLGRNVSMLMPEPDRGKHGGYIERYLKTGESKIIGVGREVTGVRRNGKTFPMHVGIAELNLRDRRSFIGFVTDQTEIRDLEDQLIHAHKMEAVGQLTGGLSHDFNNLLGVIRGNAELLAEKLEDESFGKYLDPVITATRRGAELTHRLLAFSRRQTLQPESIQLNALCAGMNDLLKRSLGETIEIEITAVDEACNVEADPGQVENALLNLAINASHAMPDGGTLAIRIENASVSSEEWAARWGGKPGEYVALRVADSGTGMPAHVLAQVFEPFFTTKEVGQGSGLGLSMVYGFAQQSGGFTAIESKQGRGTTVTIYLPRAAAAEDDTWPAVTDVEIPKGQGETILVVEDEPDLRWLTIRQLEKLGYRTLQAPDGPVALEIFSNAHDIDLLLSDVVLPGGMNGFQIYQQARERRPDLKCLFMSGYADRHGGMLPEGVDLLDKPFQFADLAGRLRLALVA